MGVSSPCSLGLENPGDFGEMARFFQESGSIVQGALLRIVVAISFLESILLDRNGAFSVHARCTDSYWLGPGTSAPRGESSIAWSIA